MNISEFVNLILQNYSYYSENQELFDIAYCVLMIAIPIIIIVSIFYIIAETVKGWYK